MKSGRDDDTDPSVELRNGGQRVDGLCFVGLWSYRVHDFTAFSSLEILKFASIFEPSPPATSLLLNMCSEGVFAEASWNLSGIVIMKLSKF